MYISHGYFGFHWHGKIILCFLFNFLPNLDRKYFDRLKFYRFFFLSSLQLNMFKNHIFSIFLFPFFHFSKIHPIKQTLTPRLEGWNGMERIILEYSFLPLFGSFNGGNEKPIPLFESLSRREWNA